MNMPEKAKDLGTLQISGPEVNLCSTIQAYNHTSYLSFFSTGTIFSSNFLHTVARKSQQNDFATKQRKSLIMKEISDFLHICHVETSEITHMWRNYRFIHIFHVEILHMWRNFRFVHICHVKLIHMWWNFRFWIFSTWQIFLHGHCPWCPWQIWGMPRPSETIRDHLRPLNTNEYHWIQLKSRRNLGEI